MAAAGKAEAAAWVWVWVGVCGGERWRRGGGRGRVVVWFERERGSHERGGKHVSTCANSHELNLAVGAVILICHTRSNGFMKAHAGTYPCR